MFTKDNSEIQNTGTHLIKLSEHYDNNCSEQEYVEVNQEVAQAYADFFNEDEKYRDWRSTHINKFCPYEVIEGTQYEKAEFFDEEYYLDRILFARLQGKCTPKVYHRAKLYFAYGFSASDIAKYENVTHTAIQKSLDKVKEILAEIYNIDME